MEIKEVEKQLGISRSNIRFYEKEGLIAPERGENNYRHYSADDVAMLRKIVVLRKVGFTVEEIRQMQNGELTLPEAAARNVTRLEEEIQRLQGALQTVREMERTQTEFDALDECAYWDKITAAEQNGERFVDICKDCLTFSLEIFDNMWKKRFAVDFRAVRSEKGILSACGELLSTCVVLGLSSLIFCGNFWYGFLRPWMIFALCIPILLPLHLIGKKHPKIAGILAEILMWCIIAFFVFIALFIIWGFGSMLLRWIF